MVYQMRHVDGTHFLLNTVIGFSLGVHVRGIGWKGGYFRIRGHT